MNGIRRTISVGAAGGVAALIVAAAPAASGLERPARALTAQTHVVHTLERLQARSIPRATGAAKLDGRLAARQGRVQVVVETSRPAAVRDLVGRLGGRVERTSPGLVQATVPAGAVSQLSRQQEVDLVRAPFMRVEHAVNGEEVAATLAKAWHDKGYTGKGVKVGIIDGGFAGLAERQAEGELPANVSSHDFCRGGFSTVTEHGTAVAEIVHEMAPEAQLYLMCIDTELDLAAAVELAKSEGIQIVNHSMGWYGPSRGDGSGYVGDLVAGAKASGILWVNSAGNDAQTHWSGTYSPNGDDVHDWASGDEGNSFVWPSGSAICGFLKWDEWPAGVSDFDLALVLSGSNELVAMSDGYQEGSEPPLEGLCVEQATGVDLVVFWAIVGYRVTTSPRFDLFSLSPPLQYQTAAGSIADPATSTSALAVGALCWQTRQLEPYSSQGPTIDGRIKPDLAGHDSVSGATYGAATSCPSAFAGTSASSPEVAGAAALVKRAYPTYGPDQLQQLLMRSATDFGTPGADNQSGAGELKMPALPDLTAPTATALASIGRPGGTVQLRSRIADESGELRVAVTVKLNGRVVATLRKGFMKAARPTTIAIGWKAPAQAKGAYRHCVQAFDRAGNKSAVSCARIRLK
jgi:subtilisin family serine protease